MDAWRVVLAWLTSNLPSPASSLGWSTAASPGSSPPRGCDLNRVPASLRVSCDSIMSRKADSAGRNGSIRRKERTASGRSRDGSMPPPECGAGASAPRCGAPAAVLSFWLNVLLHRHLLGSTTCTTPLHGLSAPWPAHPRKPHPARPPIPYRHSAKGPFLWVRGMRFVSSSRLSPKVT